MENALLVGLSRQTALAREFEVVANNIANVNTNGFRRRSTVFAEHLMPLASADDFRKPDRDISFVIDQGTWLSTARGANEQTGQLSDFAIKSDAYLVVQDERGQERYTRNGSLTTNADGELITADGNRVVTEQGVLQLAKGETNLRISADGLVITSAGQRGKLRFATFENQQTLRNEGANLFSGGNAQVALPTDIRLEIGSLENSNVKPVIEMSRMIEISRAYQSISQMIQRTDDVRRSAIQRLGDTQA
jgi:flagellar basal-body rod protein FlgF